MGKIGILTFHYSNNYGGVLQSYALYSYLKSKKFDVEIIDFIPKNYKNHKILHSTGLKRNILTLTKEDEMPKLIFKRILKKALYNRKIIYKFDSFRNKYVQMSQRVDENTFSDILENYETIVVGSDQVWNPGKRDKIEYFLGFNEKYNGRKISYAADSTTTEIDPKHLKKLQKELKDFNFISVRNEHSNAFVKSITGESVPIVVDPTLLWGNYDFKRTNLPTKIKDEKYILVYALGKEIHGTNKKAIDKIKKVYGNLKVYAVIIPTMKFNTIDYADKIFYDLGPEEWIVLFKNASFIYTDSYHGTLFSLKFRKPFIAYYSEKIRSTRFIDLGERYKISDNIVSSLEEIDEKNSLNIIPDFKSIENIINDQREASEIYLANALNIN